MCPRAHHFGLWNILNWGRLIDLNHDVPMLKRKYCTFNPVRAKDSIFKGKLDSLTLSNKLPLLVVQTQHSNWCFCVYTRHTQSSVAFFCLLLLPGPFPDSFYIFKKSIWAETKAGPALSHISNEWKPLVWPLSLACFLHWLRKSKNIPELEQSRFTLQYVVKIFEVNLNRKIALLDKSGRNEEQV